MATSRIILLLEGKEYEQETLTRASHLATKLDAELVLLHLTHSSKVRRDRIELPDAERSAQAMLEAKALISELIATLPHPVRYECLVVDNVVRELREWIAANPADLLLLGSRHHWMGGSLARLLIYKLPIDIQICHESYSANLQAVG